ncbi:MAG: PIG-L deacetylase family protein [Acidimicrobiales bacterium]
MGVSRDLATPARALAIAAHPDDVEFGCGATFAKWSASGATCHHLVLTDGSKGSWDPRQNGSELIAERKREQQAAAQALGCTGAVHFLERVDGELEADLVTRAEVARHIRELRPDVVIGHDPWKRYRLHPDHRNAGLLAIEGVVAARDPHFFSDQRIDSWRPTAILLWEADEVDHVEDVTGYVGAKLAALEAHTSQLRSTMGVIAGEPDEPAQRAAFARRVSDRLAAFGRQAGVAYGEAFKLITDL